MGKVLELESFAYVILCFLLGEKVLVFSVLFLFFKVIVKILR